MKPKWDLTQEAFDRLLTWLNPNKEQAAREYEQIRRHLIKIFICRGCTCPEDLADETINRVARRLQEIAATYAGNPHAYFCGVARNIYLEYLRAKPVPELPPTPESPHESDR